jgi:hypothetical protein
MSQPAIIARVRVAPLTGPPQEWRVPMWHMATPGYQSWVTLPTGATYEVIGVEEPADGGSEITLDRTDYIKFMGSDHG